MVLSNFAVAVLVVIMALFGGLGIVANAACLYDGTIRYSILVNFLVRGLLISACYENRKKKLITLISQK